MLTNFYRIFVIKYKGFPVLKIFKKLTGIPNLHLKKALKDR